MSKEIYISSTPHETRLAIVEGDALAEIYYERENEYTLAGSIYNGRVTRVLPGMQSAFVDIGLERDAFLYITDFMEETEDPAEFEAGGDAPRLQAGGDRFGDRSNERSGGDRGGRDRGRDRQPRHAEPRPAEPSDAELFTQAVSGLDPARPASEGEWQDRGERDRGRRGGRNRGNRGGNRDGARPESPRIEPARPVEPERAAEPIAGNISIPDSREEVGEGLPGADGSRRWRGRRGRRGNRGPIGSRPEAPVAQNETPVSATGPVYDAYPEPVEDTFDLEAAAATLPTPVEQDAFRERQEAERQEAERQERGPRDGRTDRGGRDGRRDPGRGGLPPARVPRGFAPSTNLYKVEPPEPQYGSEPEFDAPVEPIILPGESLSKYRTPTETAAGSPAASAPEAVTSEFVVEGWDGGLVLPGETIRPRGASVSPRNEAAGFRKEGSRGRDRGRREGFAAAPPVAESVPVETYSNVMEEVPASDPVTPVDSTFVPPPPVPVEMEAAVAHEAVDAPPVFEAEAEVPRVAEAEEMDLEEVEIEPVKEAPVAEAGEYEPEAASASYRVDPVAPREFRQTAVFEEPALDASEWEEPVGEIAAADEIPAGSAAAGHEVTSISDAGEMHSEPVESQVQLSEAEPMVQEIAVVEACRPAVPFFEPGSGLLEEEVLEDDEDAVVPAMEAGVSAYGAEHEALEAGTDLGAMIHDMAIEHLTGSQPLVDEEEAEDDEDFEEDFLEEDQDYEPGGEDDVDGSDEEMEADPLGEEDGAAVPEEMLVEGAPYAERPAAQDGNQEPRRDRDRGNDRGRRDGRRGDRNRRSGSGSGERSGGRHEHGRGRQTMQATNLPAISDLLKPGQEILVQIAKEPIAKKGARITSHIALPGRFLVFMPTVSHTGVSRKIESDQERRRLKEILLSERGEASGGFIVRTAAEGASEEELRSDLRFLLNLWTDIKTRSDSSKSPALIYHDLNLIERVLRDQVTDNFSAIWVDSETEYERVLRFLQRFQPSLIRRVKLYTKETPMYEQFGIAEEINKALRSKVWLKSGGSIVINQTEALVAIDINTGKFVGKTARLEDTIVKTNLDAIPEIVRQIRLRDLGGIIIIDFIDMDERKNRNRVMAALEEELKLDRAPSKVLQFNDFGLVAITRKRVKQSLERTLSTTCAVCQGTGMVKSPVTVCNDIYVEMKKMAKHLDRGDVMLRVHPEVVKQLKAPSTHWLQEMEEMCGKTILVKSDASLHPEQFDIH